MDKIMERIEHERKKKRMSQIEICRLISADKQLYSDWKHGRSESYLKRLPQIASVLKCSVEYLTTGQETPAEAWYRKYLMQSQKVRDAIDVLLRD